MEELIVDLITGKQKIIEMTPEQVADIEIIRENELTLTQQIEEKLRKKQNMEIMTMGLWEEFVPYLASILANTPQTMTFNDIMLKVAQRYLAEGGEI